MDLEATAQGGWETQALCPTIVHQGSPGPCREYRAGGLHCCSWARDPGMQDLVAVGFKGRPTPRARLRAGNEASAITILLKVSLAKCLTTLAQALTLSYLPVCLWFAYNMHDLLYLN